MKKLLLPLFPLLILSGCISQADRASYNLSKEADQFNIERRIVFFNGITDKYLLEIQGRCSLGNNDSIKELSVTCQTGVNEYKKHFLGLSDNVSYFVEQIDSKKVSPYYYTVIFAPASIIPAVDLVVPTDLPQEKIVN